MMTLKFDCSSRCGKRRMVRNRGTGAARRSPASAQGSALGCGLAAPLGLPEPARYGNANRCQLAIESWRAPVVGNVRWRF